MIEYIVRYIGQFNDIHGNLCTYNYYFYALVNELRKYILHDVKQNKIQRMLVKTL